MYTNSKCEKNTIKWINDFILEIHFGLHLLSITEIEFRTINYKCMRNTAHKTNEFQFDYSQQRWTSLMNADNDHKTSTNIRRRRRKNNNIDQPNEREITHSSQIPIISFSFSLNFNFACVYPLDVCACELFLINMRCLINERLNGRTKERKKKQNYR